MRKLLLSIICVIAASSVCLASPNGERKAYVTKSVEYTSGDTTCEGYVAYSEWNDQKVPGVLIVHEWYGLNDYARRRTREIAELGYVAFAADIYGKGVRASSNEEAAKLSGKYKSDPELFRKRVNDALAVLREQPHVDPDRIAAIGYCFGGTGVLELARSGADVLGVVSFHGGLSTKAPAEKGDVPAKVLVLHGEDDPYVKPPEVRSFKNEMDKAEVDWQLIGYSDTVHSFTNPNAGDDNSTGAAYNARSDRRSWEHMKIFFQELFTKP